MLLGYWFNLFVSYKLSRSFNERGSRGYGVSTCVVQAAIKTGRAQAARGKGVCKEF